ncbi:MAG: hypothetical protein ACLSVD_06165 [Eggerthellaceae bacterium]
MEVDPIDELSGVYRHIGSGGTVKRPEAGPGHDVQQHQGASRGPRAHRASGQPRASGTCSAAIRSSWASCSTRLWTIPSPR